MKKHILYIISVYFSVLLFCIIAVFPVCASNKYPPAPITKILAKQIINPSQAAKYMQAVIRSYTLLPKELNQILQAEYQSVNRETARMHQIKQGWRQTPPEYRLLNYKLNEQISAQSTQSRKKYAARKQRFTEFIKNAPQNRPVYVIESTNPLFFFLTVRQNSKSEHKSGITMKFSNHGIRYLSLFDADYKHIFTYHRQHVDMLENRRFIVYKTRNPRVNNSYQQLFDDYLTDLKKIGAGTDMTNRTLLRQISEMKNEYRSE